jgi:hypothetical protein
MRFLAYHGVLGKRRKRNGLVGITRRQLSLRIHQELAAWYGYSPLRRTGVYLWAFVSVNPFDWRPGTHGRPFDEIGITTFLNLAAEM